MAFEDHNGDLSTPLNPALEDHCLNCLTKDRGLANATVLRCKRVTLLIAHPQRVEPQLLGPARDRDDVLGRGPGPGRGDADANLHIAAPFRDARGPTGRPHLRAMAED